MQRLGFLDGVRALAALTVLLHHARLQIWPHAHGFDGRLAVDLFIVLSGFCLTLPLLTTTTLQGGALRFLRRRVRRILPAYYGALALSLALIGTLIGAQTGSHWDVSLPVTRNGIIAHLCLLQDVFHPYEINHALWSIAVEWHIYFLFPLLVLAWRRLGPWANAGLALALSLTVFHGLSHTVFRGVTVHFVGLFALGMLGASLASGRATRLERAWPALTAALTAAAALLLAGGFGAHLSSSRAAVLETVVGLATMTLLVAVARRPGGALDRLLSWQPLTQVGLCSYSLYLIHAPLLQVAWQYLVTPCRLGPLGSFLLLVGIGGPAIVGLAQLFFRLLEQPFLRAPAATSVTVPGRGAASPGAGA
jgi:peptidoglycan/LPS O-acetylase OafA/YrhL